MLDDRRLRKAEEWARDLTEKTLLEGIARRQGTNWEDEIPVFQRELFLRKAGVVKTSS